MKILSLVTTAALISTGAPMPAWAMPAAQSTRTCPAAATADIEAQFERLGHARS